MTENEILFFKMIPRHAVWGGKEITTYFGYDVPNKTGQVWAFSAEKSASTFCQNGDYMGMSLLDLWNSNPELFKSQFETFPYIISLVAPIADLSIQVHPTKNVAHKHGYNMGKNEAWVMLHTNDKSSLIYGSVLGFEELITHLESNDFKNTFRTVSTTTGEFFYIPAGTVHALGKGNIAYEVQQSTDVTYRIYDYDRVDNDGPRPLQLSGAIESVKDANPEYNTTLNYVKPKETELISNENLKILEYINNDSFSITKIQVSGLTTLKKNGYWLTSVTEGNGLINNQQVKFSDNFIVPANLEELSLEGEFTLMITSEHSVIK
ncbi:type I phosphomannose isomerase catalytic subunit [Dellaglioa sp. L3N]